MMMMMMTYQIVDFDEYLSCNTGLTALAQGALVVRVAEPEHEQYNGKTG